MAESFDLVIRSAILYDGTGAPGRVANVGLRGDRIASLSAPAEARSSAVVNAKGLALAPGFIDVHTHDDFAVIARPEMDFKILGGVTTCVVGNCGMGVAPWRAGMLWALAIHPQAKLPEWQGYAGYLAHLEREPPSTNVAVLMGHGTLRLSTMGNAQRAPTLSELVQMKDIVHEGLDAGAFGLSTGLVYEPGRYAATDEIVALATEMTGTRALYATHMRDEGLGLITSVREAIEVGRRAGVAVQISHHKASGRKAWGLVRQSLALIEQAQGEGLDVHADQYPYTAGSTSLAAVLQHGAFSTEGGQQGISGREDMEPSEVVIATASRHPKWEGRSVAELMTLLSKPAREVAEYVAAASPGVTVVLHTMCEDDVKAVMHHPSTMIGSDGIPALPGKPHPRLWGTFARVLGRYARDLRLLTLEDAVWRMTGLPARTFGLRDRGLIREGAFADLVVFDPARILDLGTYENPNVSPAGIYHVFVNGTQVVRDGQHTGARPGRPLRRAADT